MNAITISRQMGSWGCEIAGAVAERLGYRVVWREVINQAASRARTPEVALATIDELNLLGLKPSLDEVRAYHSAVREIMHELAETGKVVIVGRAGQVILQGVEGVLHVRIYAPLELRVQRIAEQHNVSAEAALARVTTSDQSRLSYLRRYYHARWDDIALYDVCVNTARFSVEAAAEIICGAAQARLGLHAAPPGQSAPC